MKFEDPIDIASHCARAALGMMERHGVPAHPENFAVWYAFVADRDPELTSAINTILRAGLRFTPQVNADLHERFFGAVHEEAQLVVVGQRIEDAVNKVRDYLATANRGASQYGQALETLSGQLVADPAPNDLTAMITGILDETRTMMGLTRQLEERLSHSSHEIERLRHDVEDLRREASTDPLTGLANRKLFDVALRESAMQAEEGGHFLSLLMIDIDFFKAFNDTHGHQLGDQVLKLVARTMTDTVRDDDTPARYGGEEFAIVLPRTTLADALVIAETIRKQVATRRVTNRRTGQVLGQVTLSVGVAEYEPGETLGAFVHRADEALYLAKRRGRNRVMSQADISSALGFDGEGS